MTADSNVRISGGPTVEEAAAIVAAVEALWPRPSVGSAATKAPSGNWRFSGRWWAPHELVRRPRPRR